MTHDTTSVRQGVTPSTASRQALWEAFRDDGYLTFPGLVNAERLEELRREVLEVYARADAAGRTFEGGGTLSGHLNCFPGRSSRFVHDELEQHGIFELVRELSPVALRAPRVGCNLNLPGSSEQNEHVDGYARAPFLIVNVAAVDTDLENGAMEILEGTHRRSYKYWQILLEQPRRRRLCMKQGDVLIRSSTLWHRGMPNLSRCPRPMLAFTWEDGGTAELDPYAGDGAIRFLPNRFRTDWRGRMRERAQVAAPGVGNVFRAVRSLFEH